MSDEIKENEDTIEKKKEELTSIIQEQTGLNKTADQHIQKRNELRKELEQLQSEENALIKEQAPLEAEVNTFRKELEITKDTLTGLEEFKANYSENKETLANKKFAAFACLGALTTVWVQWVSRPLEMRPSSHG